MPCDGSDTVIVLHGLASDLSFILETTPKKLLSLVEEH